MTGNRDTRARSAFTLAGIGFAGLLVLTGCADVSTDPHTGGLAGGIKGLATGAYEQRAEDKRVALQDMERAEAAMRARVADAKERLAELERRLAARNKSLQKLRADIAGISSRITAAGADALAKRTAVAMQKSETNANQAKIDEIVADRDKLVRMTRELEETNRQEALLHQKLKKPGAGEGADGAQETIVADLERRAKEADQWAAQADVRLKRLKEAVDRLGV